MLHFCLTVSWVCQAIFSPGNHILDRRMLWQAQPLGLSSQDGEPFAFLQKRQQCLGACALADGRLLPQPPSEPRWDAAHVSLWRQRLHEGETRAGKSYIISLNWYYLCHCPSLIQLFSCPSAIKDGQCLAVEACKQAEVTGAPRSAFADGRCCEAEDFPAWFHSFMIQKIKPKTPEGFFWFFLSLTGRLDYWQSLSLTGSSISFAIEPRESLTPSQTVTDSWSHWQQKNFRCWWKNL